MRHRLIWALVVPLLLVAAGCSDEPEPIFADPTSEPTSTVEPVSDPPTSTPTSEPKPETAQEFLRRFGDIERAMQTSGNTTEYRAISDGCEGCDSLADAIDGFYAAGGSVTWGGWTVISIRRYDRIRGSYLLTVDSTPTRYTERANGPEKRLPGGRSSYVFELEKEGDSWLVTDKDKLVSQ